MVSVDYGTWKQVPGIDPGCLIVSSNGWVRTPKPGHLHANPLGSPKRGTKTTNGTYRVHERRGGPTHSVHCLVARAFLGPPPTSKHTVDHKDRDPSNNAASNLRWATRSEQSYNHSTHKARQNGKHVNLDRGDNRLFNLKWASAVEQALNQTTSRANKRRKLG